MENDLNIVDFKVVEKFFRKDRWHIRFSDPFNGSRIMPNANYIWLLGNPSFVDIPAKYVIHHLDGDKVNDDISNLVIMQKHHHVAYHWKQRTIKTESKIRTSCSRIKRSVYVPIREPRIRPHKKGYRIRFSEMIDGESVRTDICVWEGRSIKTLEMAEKVKAVIWKNELVGGTDVDHSNNYAKA